VFKGLIIKKKFCKEGQRSVLIKTPSMPRLHNVGRNSVKLELDTTEGIRGQHGNILRGSADYSVGTIEVRTVTEVLYYWEKCQFLAQNMVAFIVNTAKHSGYSLKEGITPKLKTAFKSSTVILAHRLNTWLPYIVVWLWTEFHNTSGCCLLGPR
jgi:hypothetical protein